MKSKIMAGVLMFIIISVLLTGCGGKQKEIPYPDGYYVPKKEETETAGKSDKSQKNASETAKETTRETIQARAGSETENKKISFYLDTSGSMQRRSMPPPRNVPPDMRSVIFTVWTAET